MFSLRGLAFLCLLSAGCAVGLFVPAMAAHAQELPESRTTAWLLKTMGTRLGNSDEPENLRRRMRQIFRSADIDGDGGITDDDYTAQGGKQAAKSRADAFYRLIIMDIDGDGAVTRAEVEATMRTRIEQSNRSGDRIDDADRERARVLVEKLVSDRMQPDSNGDGVITLDELLADAMTRFPPAPDPVPDSRRSIPSYLDENGDGVVSPEEFSAIVERGIDYIDRDGDGHLSREEQAAAKAQAVALQRQETLERRAQDKAEKLAEQARKLAEACGFPKVPADARIVLLAVYEGRAQSTAGIGGDDQEVNVIDVNIEPGDAPLYVVATAYSAIIWRFSGAIDRIVRIVADSAQRAGDGHPRTGVTGAPAGSIHFPAARGCTPSYKTRTGPGAESPEMQSLETMIGRPVDHVAAGYDVGSVSLPGGAVAKSYVYPDRVELPRGTAGGPMWREMLRFNPGGLVRVAPETVVSNLPVKPYEVLPQQAGLAQLLDEGALKPYGAGPSILIEALPKIHDPEGTVRRITPGPAALVIQRKITFPAGLAGAHRVTFVLPAGVPEPDGSPSHSPILRQEADTE